MSEHQEPATDPTLLSLGGMSPPPELSLGLKDLLLLPKEAQDHFWEVLGPSLRVPVPKDLDQHLLAFQRQHEAPERRLARALGASRQLLRQAVGNNLTVAEFEGDLARVSEDAAKLGRILLPAYERAVPIVREEVLYGSITDHGKLLAGVDWRVDSMLLSHRGRRLQSPIAIVTLRYIEGKEQRRITLQVLPEMIDQLKAMCERIVRD
jgi:hypothetical protein